MSSLSTFQCPNCREYINTGMSQCKYCSVPIDPTIASMAVEAQEKINRACNDASLIRNLAGVMWAGFFLRFLPFISIVGWVLLFIGFIVVPFRLVLWLLRFGGIYTQDVDYKQAKRNWYVAVGLWLLSIPFVLIFIFAIAASGR